MPNHICSVCPIILFSGLTKIADRNSCSYRNDGMFVRLRNLSVQRLSWPDSKTAIWKHNFSVKVAKNRPFLDVKLNLLKGKMDFKTENLCVCTWPFSYIVRSPYIFP